MLKKLLAALCVLISVLSFAGCGATKTLTCDGCGKEVKVEASSNMEEDWAVFCEDCAKDLPQ